MQKYENERIETIDNELSIVTGNAPVHAFIFLIFVVLTGFIPGGVAKGSDNIILLLFVTLPFCVSLYGFLFALIPKTFSIQNGVVEYRYIIFLRFSEKLDDITAISFVPTSSSWFDIFIEAAGDKKMEITYMHLNRTEILKVRSLLLKNIDLSKTELKDPIANNANFN